MINTSFTILLVTEMRNAEMRNSGIFLPHTDMSIFVYIK